MDEVGAFQRRDLQAGIDRLTRHYQQPLTFAKYLIRRAGLRTTHGEGLAWSFLIRTPESIESGVLQALQKYINPALQLSKVRQRLKGAAITVNPDIVGNGGEVVADVKYKLVHPEWSTADLYQTVAFATTFRSRIGAVLSFRMDAKIRVPQES